MGKSRQDDLHCLFHRSGTTGHIDNKAALADTADSPAEHSMGCFGLSCGSNGIRKTRRHPVNYSQCSFRCYIPGS